MKLDAGSVLLQWAAGGLFFLWITTRRREVSLGYGWLMRIVYGVLATESLDERATMLLLHAGVTVGAAAAPLASRVGRASPEDAD